MVLLFVSYATSPIIIIVYDISIVIDYDIIHIVFFLTISISKAVQEKKTDCKDLWVIKPTNHVSPSSGFQVPHCKRFKC